MCSSCVRFLRTGNPWILRNWMCSSGVLFLQCQGTLYKDECMFPAVSCVHRLRNNQKECFLPAVPSSLCSVRRAVRWERETWRCRARHEARPVSCLPPPSLPSLSSPWSPWRRTTDRGRSRAEALVPDWRGALSVLVFSVTEYTEGRGDWIRGLIRRSLRLFSLEPPQSRNCSFSVGVGLLVDVEPNGGVVALTSVDTLASSRTGG